MRPEERDELEGLSFETALERLEEIVKELEQGELSLERSIRLYEEGRRLVRYCTQRLDEAQARIERLVQDEEGFHTEPMELEGTEEDGAEDEEPEGDDDDLPF
jgi:exodeoxyribonuclease VII small subunit